MVTSKSAKEIKLELFSSLLTADDSLETFLRFLTSRQKRAETRKLNNFKMNSNKKIHTSQNDEMKESDEEYSGEEDSDEGEQISAANEVN